MSIPETEYKKDKSKKFECIGGPMHSNFFDLSFLYSVSGILIAALYIPQLLNIIKSKSTLEDISLLTWGVWTICLMISVTYAVHIADDTKIALVSAASATFCGLITIITGFKRVKYQKMKTPQTQT